MGEEVRRGQAERQLCLLRLVQPGIAGKADQQPPNYPGRRMRLQSAVQVEAEPSAAVLGQIGFAKALSLMARSPAAAARCCGALIPLGHSHRELLASDFVTGAGFVDRKCRKNTGVLFPFGIGRAAFSAEARLCSRVLIATKAG